MKMCQQINTDRDLRHFRMDNCDKKIVTFTFGTLLDLEEK